MSSEARLQQDCFLWFHNSYPSLRGLLCYNLSNTEGGRRGWINKMLGLQKGRSDMVFYYNGQATMIEMKTRDGRQTPSQKEWEHKVKTEGFDYQVVRSLYQFQKLIAKKLVQGGYK